MAVPFGIDIPKTRRHPLQQLAELRQASDLLKVILVDKVALF
jgi:hypothetical protein